MTTLVKWIQKTRGKVLGGPVYMMAQFMKDFIITGSFMDTQGFYTQKAIITKGIWKSIRNMVKERKYMLMVKCRMGNGTIMNSEVKMKLSWYSIKVLNKTEFTHNKYQISIGNLIHCLLYIIFIIYNNQFIQIIVNF